jgi:hypothetical protein
MTNDTIIKAEVTDADVAALYSEMMGRTVRVGDAEYRVLDDLDAPSTSADFPSLAMAMAHAPDATIDPSCAEVEA